MRNLNILQINSAKVWGGGEVHLYQLCHGLAKRGHNVTVIGRKGSELVDRLSDLSIEVKELPLRGAADIESIIKIAAIIKNKDIDIIHLHMGRGYWLGILAHKLVRQGKVVITRHILSSLGQNFVHKWLYKSIDGFIAVSQAVKEILVNKNEFDESEIQVIYNGVDIDEFNLEIESGLKQELEIKEDEFLIGTVGRLGIKKNQELLIKAAAILKESNPEIKYVIVGKDSSPKKSYEQKLHRLIREFKVEDRVVLLGFRENISKILADLDLLVIPSKEESFGIIAVEGMAMEVPVIASGVGGLKEVIKDEETGILFAMDEVNELCESIIELIDNESKRDKLSKIGRREVERRFSVGRMLEETINLYHKLTGSSTGHL
ncbi:glycosyltransferase family 4 protein [Selenihalanaerobacter shriftii]|uniref:Glycosyltransferase involved in cell wall bisynthesis n=1 Tax=Selenihalanaerobacter shriftii TaxID=142842 RepID=A0A1T4KW41_9FIRM|nr:glycosyltransferase family 4 protein [Selenihalanaerobacter shriftii]SJZ46631.1 Glycosyltransferase involved in cell wall bisynthesis [Selenihalanaerobacter shriftii]